MDIWRGYAALQALLGSAYMIGMYVEQYTRPFEKEWVRGAYYVSSQKRLYKI